MTMVLARGAAALVGGEQAEKSCAETLVSLPYTSMSCACEELLDKKKKNPLAHRVVTDLDCLEKMK